MTTASRKVLLVEDCRDTRDLIADIAASMDVELLIATNGEEGVELACSERPGLILMDLSMPVMNGWEAATRLKAIPETAAIPIVAFTAHAMKQDERRALEAGCDHYVSKPVRVQVLRALIDQLLQPGRKAP